MSPLRRVLSLTLLATPVLLGSCDDHLLGVGGAVEGEGWCAVQDLFVSCTACHGAGGEAGLDLSTDPHGAVVDAPSTTDPSWTLVVPGDPDASLLLLKLAGTNPPGTGGAMPPGSGTPDETVATVRAWIEAGADGTCATEPTGTGRFHPLDWALPENHGQGAKFQQHECVTCHGATLEGDLGPSCDSCHEVGWRTDCTFCHGDPAEGSGAPPVHLSGTDEGAQASFIPHLAHTQDTALHDAFGCETCHVEPTSVLSVGHLFVGDDTPGRAEVDLSAGVSFEGRWDGNGTCSDLWCHGNGRSHGGTQEHTDVVSTCGDCHPGPGNPGRWDSMSGRHDDHLEFGLGCVECHPTAGPGASIDQPALHVNGQVELQLPGITREPDGDCTGSCHGQFHTSDGW